MGTGLDGNSSARGVLEGGVLEGGIAKPMDS